MTDSTDSLQPAFDARVLQTLIADASPYGSQSNRRVGAPSPTAPPKAPKFGIALPRPSSAPTQVAPGVSVSVSVATDLAAYESWFDKLAATQDDWDGYGSPKPEAHTISTARTILSALLAAQLPPDRIVRSAAGGCFVYISQGLRWADIEVFNDGELIAATHEDKTTVDMWEFTAGALADTIQRINEFFKTSRH